MKRRDRRSKWEGEKSRGLAKYLKNKFNMTLAMFGAIISPPPLADKDFPTHSQAFKNALESLSIRGKI